MKEEEKEEDEEKNKEADDYSEEIEGKRRGEEDMQDSLVVEEGMMVIFSLVFLPLSPSLQLLLQGSFHQEEVKQPHLRYTQRAGIMNYVGPPEAPDHLPLATLPCFTKQCNHSGKNFSRNSYLS